MINYVPHKLMFKNRLIDDVISIITEADYERNL